MLDSLTNLSLFLRHIHFVQPANQDNVRLLSADAPNRKFDAQQQHAPPVVGISHVRRGKVEHQNVSVRGGTSGKSTAAVSRASTSEEKPTRGSLNGGLTSVSAVTTTTGPPKNDKTVCYSTTSAVEDDIETVRSDDGAAAVASEDKDSKSTEDRASEHNAADDQMSARPPVTESSDRCEQLLGARSATPQTSEVFLSEHSAANGQQSAPVTESSDRCEQFPSARSATPQTSEIFLEGGALDRTSQNANRTDRDNLKTLLSDDEIFEDTSEDEAEQRPVRSESLGALTFQPFFPYPYVPPRRLSSLTRIASRDEWNHDTCWRFEPRRPRCWSHWLR